MSSLLSSLKGYTSSRSPLAGAGGSSGGGGGGGGGSGVSSGSYRLKASAAAGRLFGGWVGGEASGPSEETPVDPGFEDAKRRWSELDAFFTTVYQAFVQATTGIIDIARPLNRLESTVRDYFEDQEAESRLVRRFSSSVVKLNVATMRFEEVLEEERAQADLEEWLIKLEEIKRDIETRDRLYSEYVRDNKSWTHAHQKAEQRGKMDDPSTRAKLERMESAWQAAREGYKRTNKKVILSVNELSTQVKPALQQYIKALGIAQYGLYHTLNIAYSEWQDEAPESTPTLVPARSSKPNPSTPSRTSLAPQTTPTTTTTSSVTEPAPEGHIPIVMGNGNNALPISHSLPTSTAPSVSSSSNDAGANTTAPHSSLVMTPESTTSQPIASATTSSAPGPAVPPKSGVYARYSTMKQRASSSGPSPIKPLPKPPSASESPTQTQHVVNEASPVSPASTTAQQTDSRPVSSGSSISTEVGRRLEEQERRELTKQSELLAKEWRELEESRKRFEQMRRDEAEALQREKQALEELRLEKVAQAKRMQQQIEEERKLLEETKRELQRKEQLLEQREVGRQQIEGEFLRMQEERRLLEETKREMREQKLKRKLEEEWKKIEAARSELLELRQAEHARSLQAQSERLRAEQHRLAEEEELRRRREEEQREEEARAHEMLLRARRQMEEERRKIERSLRSLDDSELDEETLFSPPMAAPALDVLLVEEAKPATEPPQAVSLVPATEAQVTALSAEREVSGEAEEDHSKERGREETENKRRTVRFAEFDGEAQGDDQEDEGKHLSLVTEQHKPQDDIQLQEPEAAPSTVEDAPTSEEATTAEQGDVFVVAKEFIGTEEGELTLQPGYRVQRIEGGDDDEWWIGVVVEPASAGRPMGLFRRYAVAG